MKSFCAVKTVSVFLMQRKAFKSARNPFRYKSDYCKRAISDIKQLKLCSLAELAQTYPVSWFTHVNW